MFIKRFVRKLRDSLAPPDEHYNILTRADMLRVAAVFLDRNLISGDYLEFGIWRGQSFIQAYRATKARNLKMHYYAFDSFLGLPEVSGKDALDGRFQEGEYAMSNEDFTAVLAEAKIPPEDYTLIEGYYEESLKRQLNLPIKHASLIHIDCDLYSSTLEALSWAVRYFQNGTIIMFDDYYHYKGHPLRGEQLAIHEFLVAHPNIHFSEFQRYASMSRAFIVYFDDDPDRG